MKLFVLMENTCCNPEFLQEHGLSMYLEVGNQKILFDMGQTGGLTYNAERLGVDLAEVDLAVLSHGHYDHGGGLSAFFQKNDHAPVYINPYAFEPHYHGQGNYIGLDQILQGSGRFLTTAGKIAPGLTLYHGLRQLVTPIDHGGLHVMDQGVLSLEDYRHEQYLMVEEAGKKILISGCSHRGILNIVSYFHPDVVIGGFHCSKWEKPRLQTLAKDLMAFPTQYYTCHCTGVDAYGILKESMGEQLSYLSGGQALEL